MASEDCFWDRFLLRTFRFDLVDSIVLYSSGIEGVARVESRPNFLVDIDDSRSGDDDCFHGRPVL